MTRGGEVVVVGRVDDEKRGELVRHLEKAGFIVSTEICGCATPFVRGPNGEIFNMAEARSVLLSHDS